MISLLLSVIGLILYHGCTEAFQVTQLSFAPPQQTSTSLNKHKHQQYDFDNDNNQISRRSVLEKGSKTIGASLLLNTISVEHSDAMVGSLPEFNDSNSVIQGVTIDVADLSQQNDMIDFLREGFNFRVLRQRKVASVTETWMGFGPEEMKIPDKFEMPVSSFSEYGGHASICIRYDSKTSDRYYKPGDISPPGNNIAYLQVGVPSYRISQMMRTGGNIIDAYGIVNVISPSGFPMRGIVGINPDPIMFIALNCKNVQETREFYEQLGFIEQEYPYCRPGKGTGQFEPPQPKKSVYLAPSKYSMGVLLLQADKKLKTIQLNPVFRSMNIVYTPSEGTVVDSSEPLKISDPSGVGITFQSYKIFEKEELSTRVVGN